MKRVCSVFVFLTTILCFTEPSFAYVPHDWNLVLSRKVLQENLSEKPQNFVFSPLSLFYAAAMLANGTTGETKNELAAVLGEDFESEKLNTFLQEVHSKENKQLLISNSIRGNRFLPNYKEKLDAYLGAEVLPLPENTEKINQWISDKTNGLITDVLPVEKIQNDLGLFLVNTIYFKDEWQRYFDDVRKSKFHSLSGTLDDVYLMFRGAYMDYYEDDKMQSVRLPYKNGDYFYVFLPKEYVMTKDGETVPQHFQDFVKNLTTQDLFLDYKQEKVHLYLPQFQITLDNKNLIPLFQKWGIKRIFGGGDFSPMTDMPAPFVKEILQQAKIAVTKYGTEAAASTVIDVCGAVDMSEGMSRRPGYFTVRANRPFLFMINDGLFIGTYVNGELQEVDIKIETSSPDTE